jgi:alpha-galactosidase
VELSTRKHVFAAVAVACLSWPVGAATSNRWDLSNGVIHAVFEFGADGRFLFKQIDHLQNGVTWKASEHQPSSPIRMRFDTTTYDAGTSFRLLDQHVETPNAKTSRQVIVLEDLQWTLQFKVELEMYDGQPVLRQRVTVTNLRPQKVIARFVDLLPYNFTANQQTHRLWRVNQWSVAPRSENFQATAVTLNPNGGAASMLTGAGGLYCGWLALRNPAFGGLFAGWEFDGQAQATVQQVGLDDTVKLGVSISSLYHPVEGGATFQLPAAFLGIYQGDWDEAGFRTQNFTEAILATPAPAGFPYVSWDSWGYETEINEKILRENARIAAGLGIELFVIDLGWARQIGDWRADPQKFPRGLRSLSNYVHSLGMKFGLHFALAEAMQDSPVLQNHPGWASSGSYNYFGSRSLCLSNKPAQEWIIKQALNMIDNYGVDWIIQDGQNMVKHCTRSSHTHDPHDSNYANAVDGINAVVTAIRQQRPNTVWENCENGGNMMTFNMVQSYITSVTNDASGALGTRQGTYGAT